MTHDLRGKMMRILWPSLTLSNSCKALVFIVHVYCKKCRVLGHISKTIDLPEKAQHNVILVTGALKKGDPFIPRNFLPYY